MMQEMWNGPPGFRPTKSAPSSPAKPLGVSSRTHSEPFHIAHKVPVGDTPYVRAKNVQLVDKDPERAIPLFWAAINAGDRVDSALKDMAIVMKQQNRAEEAIEAIKCLRSRCSEQAQESLDNILLDLYKRCGRLDDQIALLRHKLFLIHQGMAFNGKRTKTARSQGRKFQVSLEQEATRLLGNLGWALMQQNNYMEAEEAYRRALLIAPDNNKMCNLGICLMKQGRIMEAKDTLRRVKPAVADGPRGVDSHLKAYERAQQMLSDLESEMLSQVVDRVEQRKLFDAFLGSSAIWQPQPCREQKQQQQQANNAAAATNDHPSSLQGEYIFADENVNTSNIVKTMTNRDVFMGQKKEGGAVVGPVVVNSLSKDAPPFYLFSNEPAFSKEFVVNGEKNLKRSRSVNAAAAAAAFVAPENNNKVQRQSSTSPERRWADLLPDDEAFEDAIIAAVLDCANETKKVVNEKKKRAEEDSGITPQKKVEKRLKVFQDITPRIIF